jgi:hypothetical protein
MRNGFQRLRHDAVIGGHYQHRHVGYWAPRARIAVKACGPRGVQEGYLLARDFGLIGANMLGDAAGLALLYMGLADGVQYARLAVVNVAP